MAVPVLKKVRFTLDGPTTAVGWPNVQGGVTRSDYGCVPSPAIGDQRLERILQTETESGIHHQCIVSMNVSLWS